MQDPNIASESQCPAASRAEPVFLTSLLPDQAIARETSGLSLSTDSALAFEDQDSVDLHVFLDPAA